MAFCLRGEAPKFFEKSCLKFVHEKFLYLSSPCPTEWHLATKCFGSHTEYHSPTIGCESWNDSFFVSLTCDSSFPARKRYAAARYYHRTIMSSARTSGNHKNFRSKTRGLLEELAMKNIGLAMKPKFRGRVHQTRGNCAAADNGSKVVSNFEPATVASLRVL